MAWKSVEFKDLTEVNFPEDFTELKFDRSCPLFRTKVLGSKIGKEITGFAHHGCLIQSSPGIQKEAILTELNKFAAKKDTTVWIFNNLAVYFGLPISECLPDCVVAQVFVLGKSNRSPFILTLYQDKILATETKTKVRRFTVKVAKELFTLLINFCSCEFVILPCILSYEDFLHNQSSLETELKEQLLHTHSFYNGPDVLDSKTYNALAQAVRVVQGISSIPLQLKDPKTEVMSSMSYPLKEPKTEVMSSMSYPLKEPKTEDGLVVLDTAWQEAMQQAIVHLMSSGKRYNCTKENEFKVMVAVLEAARRISFSSKVEVRTSDENVKLCLDHVKELTKKEIGIPLNLEGVYIKAKLSEMQSGRESGGSRKRSPHSTTTMQSGIHIVCCDAREEKKNLLSCTVKTAMDETE